MKIKIKEEQLSLLTTEASLGDDIKSLNFKNISNGLRGVWKGEGYEYMSYLTSVLKILKSLENNLSYYEKLEKAINNIESDIRNSNLSRNKKISVRSYFSKILDEYKKVKDFVELTKEKLEKKLK